MQNETNLPKQRLAIFLDGTWNTQDDSTNILHAHALTFEGMSDDGFIQKRYYDRGVGTGLLDSVLGGGFGMGLEVNVREAYNWLVDNYNGEEDEIYIFGFSRGAYSARSLVGFIAICGLIKRGAPLTNSQLWEGYVKISRARGGQKTLLEKIGTSIQPPFRKIKDISKGNGKNTTENLLKEWSRRVKISYLGIFDTVGAMGLEALGIQGLRSRSGLNHNQNPTKLIQKCRHALAIDEYRSSFRLTPFLDYMPNVISKESVIKKDYRDQISQKWFIGAHSNIGGGYNDNLLAYYPLKWVLDGAKSVGLQMGEIVKSDYCAGVNQVNDSYKDFTGIVWPHIFREKRHYRQINQTDTIVAGVYSKIDKTTGRSKMIKNGFSLRPIFEEIDESVVDLIKAADNEDYVPPNLKNYANRINVEENVEEVIGEKEKIDREIKTLFANRKPKEKWLEETVLARVILVCWATLAAIGVAFLLDGLLINASFLNWESIALIALGFTIADCAEFHFNLKIALNPSAIISKVALNVLLWIRLMGIIFFFFGAIAFTLQCIDWGWSSEMSIEKIVDLVKTKNWYLIPFFPMVAVLLLDFFYNGFEKIEKKITFNPNFKHIVPTILSPIVFILFGFLIVYFSGFLIGFSSSEMIPSATPNLTTKALAGQLLLIQILLLILNYAFIWVGKPTRKARLGFAITGLQFSYTPKMIEELFDVLRFNISQRWAADTKKEIKTIAWENTKGLVRESVWRDILGFIPIYTFVFGAIMWFASAYGSHEYWNWLNDEKIMNIPLWIWIISITAIADYFENIVHLRHVKNYSLGGSSYGLIIVGLLFTIIKFIGFFSALICSTLIFINLSFDILTAEPGGWRWLIAVLITLITIYVLGAYLISVIRRKLVFKTKKD